MTGAGESLVEDRPWIVPPGSSICDVATTLQNRLDENPWVAVESMLRHGRYPQRRQWNVFRAYQVSVEHGQLKLLGRKGERSFGHAVLEQTDADFSYRLATDVVPCAMLAPVRTNFVPQVSYGTGGIEPPSRWTEEHTGGTTKVLFGAQAQALCPDAITAIQFAERAFTVNIPAHYCMPGFLVSENDVPRSARGRRESDLSTLATLDAVRRLLGRSSDRVHRPLPVEQLGTYADASAVTHFRGRGYPVVRTDFRIGHGVAFAKVGYGVRFGDAYVLPSERHVDLVAHALSPEAVQAMYPDTF